LTIETDNSTKEKIIKGIDDAVYGLMMMMDGVTGSLRNKEYAVTIESIITLVRNRETIQEINTFHGDGMCMGLHMWKDDDFGEEDICPFRIFID